jgi:hypothetical protein
MPRRPLLLSVALATAALLVPAAPALAHPDVELAPTLPTDLSFAATDNVQYLGRFPQHTGTAGGALSSDGTRFYLTDPRGVHVYDTSTPEDPRLLGSLPLPQSETGVALAQEDPDTNDEILLVDAVAPAVSTAPSARTAALHVVDVSDPTSLRTLATVPVTDHTWTCVSGVDARRKQNSCAWAYGRSGHIVDLRDPAQPSLLDRTWRAAVGYGDRGNDPYTHDLTEIRPGLVMSAGSTSILMDTSDPARPLRLTAIEQEERFPSLGYHSVEWARGGTSPWLVAGTEIAPGGPTNLAGSDCQGDSSVVETWDARAVVKALRSYRPGTGAKGLRGARFTKVDAFDAAGRGIFLDGAAPAHLLYCAHWMELHPDFRDSGRMAVSYYDRGTRFVDVDKAGTMTEIGWIVPAEGYSGSPQWISDDVVYVMDYRRGLEVVRLLDEPATGTRRSVIDVIAPGALELAAASRPAPLGRAHTALLGSALGVLLLCVAVLRRRALRLGARG